MVRYLPFREKKDLKGVKAGSTLPVFADVQSCSNKGDVGASLKLFIPRVKGRRINSSEKVV